MLKLYHPRFAILGCALLVLAGCAADDPEQPQTSGDASGAAVMSMSQAARTNEPKDAPQALNIVFQVEVYQLAVPFGTLSGNEEFWRRINEQAVDVATYDLLYRNGIRVGEAPMSELQSFKKHLADIVPAQRLTVTAVEVKNVEVPMKKDLVEQTIFYYDGQNNLIGEGFDRCENFINLSFEPTPRRPGYLRLALCPMVRSQRKVLQFGPNNQHRELEFISPQRLYDLNLRADIPRDSFLVVTASPLAKDWSVSVGRAFMTVDGPAERMEQVLLIIPKPYVASPGEGEVTGVK